MAMADSSAEDEDTEEEEGRKGRSEAEEIDPAQFALPTFLTAGTIFGSVIRVDLTKVRVDVETNDLSKKVIFDLTNAVCTGCLIWSRTWVRLT